jgi:hypothetical protein
MDIMVCQCKGEEEDMAEDMAVRAVEISHLEWGHSMVVHLDSITVVEAEVGEGEVSLTFLSLGGGGWRVQMIEAEVEVAMAVVVEIDTLLRAPESGLGRWSSSSGMKR